MKDFLLLCIVIQLLGLTAVVVEAKRDVVRAIREVGVGKVGK